MYIRSKIRLHLCVSYNYDSASIRRRSTTIRRESTATQRPFDAERQSNGRRMGVERRHIEVFVVTSGADLS